jgi:hypothetical protein
MTKSGAVDCLERIERILQDFESYDRLDAGRKSELKRRAANERREIGDVVSFIKRLDREARRDD